MKTLEEYEAWVENDPDSMTGEDLFYYCYLEFCPIWYEEDDGELVRFINHWSLDHLGITVHMIHGFNVSWTDKEGTRHEFEYDGVEEMLDGHNMPDGKTLREVLRMSDKKDLYL
ncbi:MAG: hypothetical protein IJD43_00785 [Thermoguttaceae bacterium]|nr:hypothetical protein [Thermoguttaceae bacterium]